MLELKNINYYYLNKKSQNKVTVFDDFNLTIKDREFVSLVGPSGCGKSTLVKIIAGYINLIDGEIFIGNKKVKSPGRDRIVINQENDIFEWMTVFDNMRLVTKNSEAIEKYLFLTGLHDVKNNYPRELSGGMKKRLSLARALVVDPSFIIMDEPFGSLDYQIKEKLHEELLAIVKNANKTILLVTHDIEEAAFLSDRIILLSKDRPTTIKNDIKINFSKERTVEIKDSNEFIEVKKMIKYLINNEKIL